MFDVSFGELLLILIVGLLVFGPEKLPQVVRTGSQWINHLRRSFNQIRADIEREVGVDELKREIHNQSILDSLRDVKKDLQGTQRQIEELPYEVSDSVRQNFRRESESPDSASEHIIPDNDFAHRDQPAIDAPATAAEEEQSSAETPPPSPRS